MQRAHPACLDVHIDVAHASSLQQHLPSHLCWVAASGGGAAGLLPPWAAAGWMLTSCKDIFCQTHVCMRRCLPAHVQSSRLCHICHPRTCSIVRHAELQKNIRMCTTQMRTVSTITDGRTLDGRWATKPKYSGKPKDFRVLVQVLFNNKQLYYKGHSSRITQTMFR